MSNITNLLTALSTDADLQAQYKNDPEAVMDSYNLTEEEKTLMADKDLTKLAEGIGDELVYGKHIFASN